jgi:hypothetical protein
MSKTMDGISDEYATLGFGQDAAPCTCAAAVSSCAAAITPCAVAASSSVPSGGIAALLASTDPDVIAGLNALTVFWQAAMPLNPQLPTDFPSFLSALEQSLVPGQTGATQDNIFTIQVQGIGTQVNVGGTPGFFSTGTVPMTSAQVATAMQALASQGSGKLPTNMNGFTAALTGSATTVNFLSAVTYTAEASTAQVAQAAQAAGNAIIDTASTALAWKNYLIWGAVAFGAFLLYIKFGGKLSSGKPTEEVKANPSRRKHKKKR